MKAFLAIALSLWLGAGGGAIADDYTGNWWIVYVGVGIVLATVTTLYLRRPAR